MAIRKEPEFYKVGFGKYKDKKLLWVFKNDVEYCKEIKKSFFKKYSKEKQEYYELTYNQHVLNKGIRPAMQDKAHECFLMFRERKTRNEVSQFLIEKYGIQNPTTRGIIISNSHNLLHEHYLNERKNLIHLHIMRYEQIYKKNVDLKFNGNKKLVNLLKRQAYTVAIDAMLSKEKLLGIHTKQFKVKFNSYKKEKEIKDLDYNLSNLSFDEQLDFLLLINKIKKVEEINFFAIKNTEETIDNKEYVDFEEIKYETPLKGEKTIDSIKQKHQDEQKIISTNVLDFSNKEKQKENLENVIEKINKSNIESFTKLFKK